MNLKATAFPLHPLFIFAILIVISLTSYWLWSLGVNTTDENGLLEFGQDVFLILACAMSAYRYKGATTILYRFVYSGLMIFCFAILLREIDIDKIGVSPIWEVVETFARGLALVALLVYLFFMIKKFRGLREGIPDILTSPIFLLTLIGCLSYIGGWPFDKLIFLDSARDLAVAIEETLELNATLLFFFASCAKELKK
jgi:hypothetical protein